MDACCICNLQLLSNEGQYRAPHFKLEPYAKLGVDRFAHHACIKLQLQSQWLFAPTLLWG